MTAGEASAPVADPIGRMAAAAVAEAVAELRAGRPIMLVGGEAREAPGALIVAAEHADAAAVRAVTGAGAGLLCVALTAERMDALDIPPMVGEAASRPGPIYGVGVDARSVASPLSAQGRARTVATLAAPATRRDDLLRPGHVIPVLARAGGVLEWPGHAEAALDLMRLAALGDVAAISPVAEVDDAPANRDALRALARERGLVALDLGDLVAHRRRVEPRVVRDCEAELPLLAGTFTAIGYRDRVDGTEHMALTVGDVAGAEAPLVALHAECVAGDVFRASRCDCGELLERSLGLIAAEGRGAIVHVRRQWGGRSCPRAGLGLSGPDDGQGAVALDRSAIWKAEVTGAQVLADLGVREVRLVAGEDVDVTALEAHGLRVVGRVDPGGGRRPAGSGSS